MKKIAALLLAVPLLAVASCGPSVVETSSSSSSSNSSVAQSTSTSEPSVDFTIKTEDRYLSIEKGNYSFAMAEDGDAHPDEAAVTINCSWGMTTTSLSERYTKIDIEDEKVIPEEAVSYETKDTLTGTGGNNGIVAIEIKFDRSLIKEGTSKVRFQTRPGNGISVSNNLVICFEVEVLPFGGIVVDTYDVSMEVDISDLGGILKDVVNPTEASFHVTDTEYIYGYSADRLVSAEIELNGNYDTIEIPTFKFAKGHVYKAYLFIDAEKFSDRLWLPIESSSPSSDYAIEILENKQESSVEVSADCHIVATLVA